MEHQRKPLSIKIIYWLTNFSFGILGLILLVTIVFNILLYTGSFGNNFQLHTQLPVKVDFLEIGNLHLNGKDVKVELVEATTKIHFFNTPKFITRRIGIVIFIVVLGAFYLTWIFQTFIKNVKNGDIFNIKNIMLLKKLSYGLVGFWLLTIVYMRVFYYYIVENLEFERIYLRDDIPNYFGVLFVALLVWILAHIFITGLKLQQEKDLTI